MNLQMTIIINLTKNIIIFYLFPSSLLKISSLLNFFRDFKRHEITPLHTITFYWRIKVYNCVTLVSWNFKQIIIKRIKYYYYHLVDHYYFQYQNIFFHMYSYFLTFIFQGYLFFYGKRSQLSWHSIFDFPKQNTSTAPLFACLHKRL